MKRFFKEWGGFLLFMTALVLSWLFIWVNFTIDGHSMDPTLAPNDKVFTLRVASIDRFDIVVAKEDSGGEVKRVVKRVIGMPGDTISYDNDVLTVNGQVVDEPYLADYLAKFKDDKLQETYAYNQLFQDLAKNSEAFTAMDNGQTTSFSLTVPEGEYYLLGDDRIVSKDSRHVGTFKKDSIIGEVMFRIWPLNSFGSVD